MESPHDFDAVHWDHEPVWVVPSVWCPAFRRPGPAKAGTPNRRFMERGLGRGWKAPARMARIGALTGNSALDTRRSTLDIFPR